MRVDLDGEAARCCCNVPFVKHVHINAPPFVCLWKARLESRTCPSSKLATYIQYIDNLLVTTVMYVVYPTETYHRIYDSYPHPDVQTPRTRV